MTWTAAWIDEIEGAHEEEDDDEEEHEHEEHGHHGHHHHHHDEGEAEEYGISTFVYYRRDPFDINRFDHYVARKWDKSVIRSKGICYFSDEPDKCYLFEQAGLQKSIKDAGLWYATMPADELGAMMLQDPKLAQDWDELYGDRMIKIVFIGQHMDKDAICAALDECLSPISRH